MSARQRVLVVPDRADDVERLREALGQTYDLAVAATGDEALSAVVHHPTDLLLLGLELPDRSGYDLCRLLKSDPITARVPILLLVDQGAEEEAVAGLSLGAADCLARPFHPALVAARVGTHLELRARSEALARLAHVDDVTGIPDRRHFDEALEREWRRAYRAQSWLTILLVDVDHFQAYAERYGAAAADLCLQVVSGHLVKILSRVSDTVARYEGDELVGLLPSTDPAGAVEIADGIRAGVRGIGLVHERSSVADVVTVSVGVASARVDVGSSPQALLRAAAGALLEAKEAGRDRIVRRVVD